jgi:HEAT repeat protein
MNCQEVNFILDARAPEELDPTERQAVELHLTSCQGCRDAWAAYRELAAQPIPKTPPDLRLRIAAALAARAPAGTRRPRRALFLGGALIVGAAVAAGIATQVAERAPEIARRIDEPAPAAAPALPAAAEEAPAAGAPVAGNQAAIASADGAALPSNTATNSAVLALDPHSIVVFAEPDPAADPQATAEFARCHEQVLEQLRAVQGLNVIAGARVAAFDALDLAPEEIARELGAGTALVLKIMGHQPSCSATWFDTQDGAEQEPGVRAFDGDRQNDGWKSFAAKVAELTRNNTLKDTSTLIAEAQATVLNTALSDADRAHALFNLRQPPTWSLEGYDAAVVVAAAQIAMTSHDAQAAWVGLRGVADPYLTQPLIHSLANDADENVRRAAAFALAYLVDEPGVRDALARAAAEDPSQHRARRCCTASVREAAERSLLSEQQLVDLTLETLMNDALTDLERIEPMMESVDGRGVPVSLSDEAARAVFDIGRRSEDSGVRARAWWSLGRGGPTPEFAQTLLADLTSHPEENVRGAAAAGLVQYTDDPAVRTGLERALAEDASQNVRRRARDALNGVTR